MPFVYLNCIECSSNGALVELIRWSDLRYLLGEIMYGGHVTDDWDRRLCRAYLEELLQPELLEGELFLAPCFPSPPNRDYIGYHRYIDEALPPESTYLYGMREKRVVLELESVTGQLYSCRSVITWRLEFLVKVLASSSDILFRVEQQVIELENTNKNCISHSLMGWKPTAFIEGLEILSY